MTPPIPTPDGYECLVQTRGAGYSQVRWWSSDARWHWLHNGAPIAPDRILSFAPLPGWRKLDGQEATQPVRVLLGVVGATDQRIIIDYEHGFTEGMAAGMSNAWTPLAYRPADPLTLPPDWLPHD